jgi:hypothetical protein
MTRTDGGIGQRRFVNLGILVVRAIKQHVIKPHAADGAADRLRVWTPNFGSVPGHLSITPFELNPRSEAARAVAMGST